MGKKVSAEATVKDIRRQTRRQHNAEEKIRIVLEGLRGEETITELCRWEGITQSLYYKWSKEFLEAGKSRLAGDTKRQASGDDVEELISTFDNEYTFVDDGNYDNRFGISTIIQDEPRFPSSVRLCLQRNVVQVIAVGYYNGLLAPRPSLSDFLAQFGVPDAIIWTDNPASRVAFWFEQGIATVVTVIPNTPGYTQLEPTFDRVEVEIYFAYQNVEDYEDRWPYNQTRKFNEFLVHAEEADFGAENPFDYEEMIATITAQPALTPTPTLTQSPATPTATPSP